MPDISGVNATGQRIGSTDGYWVTLMIGSQAQVIMDGDDACIEDVNLSLRPLPLTQNALLLVFGFEIMEQQRASSMCLLCRVLSLTDFTMRMSRTSSRVAALC
jgi:hypothetical protein